MGLLDLPVELLDSVISLITVDKSFRSFALTSKAAYAACESFIPRHNSLRGKWSSICLADGNCEANHIVDVVQGVLQEPDAVYFIEKLDLRDDTDEDEAGLDTADLETLHDLILRSPYLSPSDESVHKWKSAFSSSAPREEDRMDSMQKALFRSTFLLTLLPNLVELTLPSSWSYISREAPEGYQVLTNLAIHSHQSCGRAPRDDLPLGRLKYLHPHEEGEYDPMPQTGSKVFAPFLAMPSLTHFHAVNLNIVEDGYTGVPFNWPLDAETDSNVHDVKLTAGCINAEGIAQLLEHMPQVKSLEYSHHTKWHGCEHDWNAGAFVNAVAATRGDTLTRLSVTVDTLFGEVENGIVSLKDFLSLEDINLDIRLFDAPAPDSGAQLGQAETGPQGWGTQDIPHLEQILPSSVRSLTLFSRGGRDANDVRDRAVLRRLFGSGQELLASNSFPRLERVVVGLHDLKIIGKEVKDDASKEIPDGKDKTEAPPLYRILTMAGAQWAQLAE